MDNHQRSNLKNISVLYVEDDAATREELAMILEPAVSQLHVAADGQAGLALYVQERPDIVVTDIQMPCLNGLAMSAEIRKINPDQPIVILSAYNDLDYLFRAIDLGVNHYVTKPVDIEKLLTRLAEIAGVRIALKERQRGNVLLQQYRHLVDASALVVKTDPSHCITFVNDGFCKTTGFGRDELTGQDIRFIRHPDEDAERIDRIHKSLAQGEKWTGILKNRTRSGGLLVVESSIVPIVNESGEIEEFVSLDVDITDIHEGFERLVDALGHSQCSLDEQRHYLQEYKRALELGTCVCTTSANGRILSANHRFAKTLGYSADELEGVNLHELMVDPDIKWPTDVKHNDNASQNQVLRFRNRNGEEMVFSTVVVVVRDLARSVDSVVLVCQDITESLRATNAVLETQRELLFLMGDVVENRSKETGQHVKRVAEISRFLAIKSGLSREVAEMIKVAAPMHDIGKVGIPDAILHKPGKLDAAELAIMRTHAELGFSLLKGLEQPIVQMAARIAHEHHERYDGSGYPQGLQGEGISIEGRIVSVADVLDALGHARVYKPAWPKEAIQSYFREQRGRQFDPLLVDILLDNWNEITGILARYPGA